MRYPKATWYGGPPAKQGYPGYPSGNAISGIVLHSMDGNWDTGGVNILINGGTSWHFSVLRDGAVLQHYELEAECWHSGNASINRRTIGIEHEGYHSPEYGHGVESLTEAQIQSSVELCEWIADIPVAWKIERGTTLFLHKDLGTSECPGTRFDNIIERWTMPEPDTSTLLPVNTNIAQSWDIGLDRLTLIEIGKIIGKDFKRHAGALQDIVAAITEGYNS